MPKTPDNPYVVTMEWIPGPPNPEFDEWYHKYIQELLAKAELTSWASPKDTNL